MRKLVLSVLLSMQALIAFSQASTGLTGKVVDAKSQRPMQNVEVSVANTNLTELTNINGLFTFKEVAVGEQIIRVRSTGFKDQIIPVSIKQGQVLDIGMVVLEEDITSEQQLALITITENDLGDDNSGSENTAGLLQATRDQFQQSAAFNWGQARFRIRGFDNEYGVTMINGITMNKIYDGRPQWSNWGGLNDATRNQEFTMGSAPSDYTFGSILGTQEINTRASIYRPGTRVSFSGTNTNYSWRTMATHASGMDKNGWAYVVSASRRWAKEGYFEGTDYDAYSVFASVEKRFNEHHSLNFTSIYARNSRGKNSPNTAEVNAIAGEEYNSYWGWQNGKKRNSRDKDVEEPINMLTHYWKFNDKTSLQTNVAYQTGSVGNSRLDYQDARNPDPTYYRNLPSYYGYAVGSDQAQNTPFAQNPQINWDFLYFANQNTEEGNSVYVLYEDRTDDTQWSANSILNSQLSDNIALNAGVNFRKLKSHNFQYLLDFLGGDFYKDIDPFGTGDQQQSDLNNPNRIIKPDGDRTFGYNYNLEATVADAFTQFKFAYRDFDFYLAQNFTRTEYQREGLYRNGYYANNSFGKSKSVVFENFGFKGGLTYKLNGQNYFVFNGLYMTKAPTMRNVFPNARLSNNIMEEAVSENIVSTDGSYVIRTPKLKARLTGYYAKVKNATETSFFFAEGIFEGEGSDETDAFVAETVTNLDKKYMGGELGIEYQLTPTIKIMGSAAYGQYIYDNNPNVYLNQDAAATPDNPNPLVNYGVSKMKNYRLPGSPQQAYSVGVEYRDPHFWWVGVNGNYLADNYLDVSPILRTDNFFRDPATGDSFLDIDPARARQLLKQEQFDNFYLVNLTGGKSWKIDGTTFGFFASINNLLDEKYRTGGFEQARNANYRGLDADVASGTPVFGPRYFQGYGRTYFVNLYVQF
ncbi:TonB-dependent receptor [Flavobacterium selenitireducens]|uniref:TonB-dependent receptor n=1 Tax=Flavobacterium selenitireducens TaxID=2722704 RepID=UPI00168B34F9|nr:TonB-dependent receptor [Flavobacterium selenitireducens]MBD3582036.1 TonB-dependent receptor [Flavobacterium selenitireducens]